MRYGGQTAPHWTAHTIGCENNSNGNITMPLSLGKKRQYCLRARLHEGGGPQVGEVTYGGSPHLSCKRDERLYGQAGYPT